MLRSLLALVTVLVFTPVIAVGAIVWTVMRGREEIDLAPAVLWSRLMLAVAGIRVEYEGLEHRLGQRPCIYASNHRSNVDIWVLICALAPNTKFVAKESLFRIPFLGWAMRKAGYIPIDRSKRGRAIESLRRAADRIRAGRPVIVFPEGTRSKDGRLAPFKKGPFHLALQAGVPVVPVAISGSWELLPPGSWRLRAGMVRVRFLPPLDIAPFKPDRYVGLLELTYQRIEAALPPEAVAADRDHAVPAGAP